MPLTLDTAGRARVIDLRRQGLARADIVKATGASPATIGRILRSAGETAPSDLRPGGRIAIARMYRMTGETYARLAEQLNLAPHVVAESVRKYGKPARRGRPAKGDTRKGKRRREQPAADYPHDDLGRRGRQAWTAWRVELLDDSQVSREDALAHKHIVAGLDPASVELNRNVGARQREERREHGHAWDKAWPGSWRTSWRAPADHEAKARRARAGFTEAMRRARVEKLSADVRAAGDAWPSERCQQLELEMRSPPPRDVAKYVEPERGELYGFERWMRRVMRQTLGVNAI